MVEFKKGRYIIGMWFVAMDQKDWMAMVYTDDPEKKKWQLTYRWRYYGKDHGDPFKDEDRKSWYGGEITDTEDSVILKLDSMAHLIAETMEGQYYFAEMKSDDPVANIGVLTMHPWAHMKKVTKEEYEKYDMPVSSPETGEA